MRSIATLSLLLLIPTTSVAQSNAELIAEATSPLPPRLRDGATVANSDGTLLREGTNAYICRRNAVRTGYNVACGDKRVQPAMEEYFKLRAEGLPEDEILARVVAAVQAGTVRAIPAIVSGNVASDSSRLFSVTVSGPCVSVRVTVNVVAPPLSLISVSDKVTTSCS